MAEHHTISPHVLVSDDRVLTLPTDADGCKGMDVRRA